MKKSLLLISLTISALIAQPGQFGVPSSISFQGMLTNATGSLYEDGEYSVFAPWSEVAFMPGDFDFMPKKGYNLGMVNNIRQLAIKDFVHPRLLPDDVISIVYRL